jgi:nicotinamide-nucleotide amidase
MKAEIISIGTELLLGQITDTNASYLAGELPALGIDLYFISQVGDNLGRLVETLRRAWQRSDVVITTGGLGPTEDDLTREAIAALMGEEMILQPHLEAELRAYFGRRGRPITPNNLKQASLIASASALPNPVGTAPGWWVEKDGHVIVSMPGVPREMFRMWSDQATPRLRALRGRGESVIVSRTIKLLGIGESAAEDKIRHLLSSTNPTIGTYAKNDGIHLRLTAKAASEAEALAAIAPMEKQLREILGVFVYGYDHDTPSTVAADLLLKHKLSLGIMETCTGGFVASAIMDDLRYPAFFKGGLVAPTQQALLDAGVPSSVLSASGMSSMAVAEAMATAVRTRMGVDVAIGVTGLMPGDMVGGTIPPGSINVALHDGEMRTASMVFPTIQADVKRWAMLTALNLIRLRLLGAA